VRESDIFSEFRMVARVPSYDLQVIRVFAGMTVLMALSAIMKRSLRGKEITLSGKEIIHGSLKGLDDHEDSGRCFA